MCVWKRSEPLLRTDMQLYSSAYNNNLDAICMTILSDYFGPGSMQSLSTELGHRADSAPEAPGAFLSENLLFSTSHSVHI